MTKVLLYIYVFFPLQESLTRNRVHDICFLFPYNLIFLEDFCHHFWTEYTIEEYEKKMESKTKSSMLLYLKFILFLNKGIVFQFFFVIRKSIWRIGILEIFFKKKRTEIH